MRGLGVCESFLGDCGLGGYNPRRRRNSQVNMNEMGCYV